LGRPMMAIVKGISDPCALGAYSAKLSSGFAKGIRAD
jgi:hypothetical protein